MATDWRPIETADKSDDEGFILWCGCDFGPQMGLWDDGYWVTFDGRRLDDCAAPTHWAPLPEPPGSTDG